MSGWTGQVHRTPGWLAGVVVMLGLVAAVAGASPRAASPDAQASRERLTYRGYATANDQRSRCYARRGLYVGLQARHPGPRVSLRRLRKVAAANRPTHARLVLRGHSYGLTIDAASSGYAFRQVWWNFRVVRTSKRTAKRAVGERARILYRSGRKRYTTKPIRVAADPC